MMTVYLTPTDDRTLDSIVKGGLFTSALGHAPSDILLEGDDLYHQIQVTHRKKLYLDNCLTQ